MLAPFCQCLKFVILVEFPHIILKLTTVQPLSRQIVISSCSLALFLHPINHQGCYQCSTQTWIIKTTVYFLAHPNNWQQVLTVRQTIVFCKQSDAKSVLLQSFPNQDPLILPVARKLCNILFLQSESH